MRHGLFAVAVMLMATAAAAQPDEEEEEAKPAKAQKGKKGDKEKGDKEKGDEDEKEGGGAGMMDQTAPDPAETERAEKPEVKKKPKVTVKSSGQVGVEEAEESAFQPERKRLHLLGELLIGFGGTPVVGPADEEENAGTEGTVFALRVGASYDFSKRFSLGLLIPWTTGTVKDPVFAVGGQREQSTNALGAPLLTAEIRSPLGKNSTVPWGLAVGIPVAQGTPDISGSDTAGIAQLKLNMLADANSGWRDPELYAPKRLPVVPFAGIQHAKGRFEVGAFAKLAFLFNVGGELTDTSFGNGTLELSSVALRTVIGTGAKYWFLKSPMMFGGLDLWMAHNTIRPITFKSGDADEPNPIQFVIEPKVGMRFGGVVPSVGFVFPLGGDLGEHDSKGLRLSVTGNF
jgi:hypothetical protein